MDNGVLDEATAIARAEVVPLLRRMLSFDTSAGAHDDPPRAEAAHQEFVAGYLEELGAEVELFEPQPELFADHRMALPHQTFEARPVLWARIPGTAGGRTLLFNGHYDTVLPDPLDAWTHDPLGAAEVDAHVFGRGACDMKGGNACALAALSGLVRAGARLPGDVFVNLVPFEEVNGMGTTATMLSGRRADAAICCEPTELRPLAACRGVMALALSVVGRLAHAEIAQPHHSQGGGVSAIDALVHLLASIDKLNGTWRRRPDKQHALLSTPSLITSLIEGGSFWASWPATAKATFDVTYLPGDADDDGYGSRVRAEIERHVAAASQLDDWLAEHPPRLECLIDYPPIEIPVGHPLVDLVIRAAEVERDEPVTVGGFDSWADQVMLVKEGAIPTVLFGPGSILQAHTADEFVPVADLEACTAIYLRVAASWGEAPTLERQQRWAGRGGRT